MRQLIIAIVLTLLLPTICQAASIDPDYKFRTIETEHFWIHYHQGLQDTALKAASMAETAHRAMSAPMGWEPEEKTSLVLVDNTDMANGFATVLPYNLIYIYTVPPEPDMSIGQYDNWLRMVITHEYAHILTIDMSRGYSTLARSIFGKPLPMADPYSLPFFLAAAPPVLFTPGWWHEGLAVWAETEFAGMGRGKATHYDMILRAAVAEDRLPSIDMINGDHPDWPGGSMRYIYGMAFVRYISQKYGADTLFKLNYDHAGRLPYMLNRPPKVRTGKSYPHLFAEAMQQLKKTQKANIETIAKADITVPALLPATQGQNMSRPAPFNNTLAVHVSNPHSHNAIAIINSTTGKETHRVRVNATTSSMAWSGDRLYYCDLELRDGYNSVLDLYSYDTSTQKTKQLTRGLRVKDPAISSKGQIAVINIKAESQSLAILSLADNENDPKQDELVRLANTRLSNPSWDREAGRIVFAAKNSSDGMSTIYLYDIGTDILRPLFSATHNLNYPSFTSDNTVLYSSDESGVSNLYEYNINTQKTRGLTNLIGGAYHPVTSGERIYFSSYTAEGFRAAYIIYPSPSAKGNTLAIPKIKAYWPEKGFYTSTASSENASISNTPSTPIDRPYSALWGVLPKFWLPTIFGDHTGIGPGLLSAAQDPLFYHTWYLTAGTGNSGNGYYLFDYRYDRYYPTLNIQAARLPIYYHELFAPDFSLYERQDTVSASLTFPIKRLSSMAYLELGYQRKEQTMLEGALPVFEGRRDNVFARLYFNNARKYPYSISMEEGRTLRFEVRDYSRDRGSMVDSREYAASYEEYTHLGGHKALYLKLTGAASKGDSIKQQAFRMGGSLMENLLYPLRGYDAGYKTGDYLAIGTLELRLPVKNIQRGQGTRPFFAKQIHVALFVDSGAAWSSGQTLHKDSWDVGAGIEVRADITLGYMFTITPSIGYAHGFAKNTGKDMIYFVIHIQL